MRLLLCTLALMTACSGATAASGTGAAPLDGQPLPTAPAAALPLAPPATALKKPKPVTTPGLLEPHLTLVKRAETGQRVALTFDACSGKTDPRILQTLVDNRIPATLFATARWIRRNPEAVALLKANPDLFEVENHGAAHIPAVDRPAMVYGIPAAGSPEAVAAEVKGGADALVAAGFPAPHWFRGATARYSPSAIAEITTMGYRVAGFSLNGDDGALAPAAVAEKRLATARDGSVVIAHINQPDRAAGAGIAAGILALKARGVIFVRLMDADEVAGKAGH